MNKEVGSEFWIENSSYECMKDTPEWISQYGEIVLTSSGRGAISLLLEEVEPVFKTVLLPAYTCESVILPFITQGYTCYFYDINEDLSPNIESIEMHQKIGIFLHMGYFGFQTNIDLLDVIKQLKHDMTIIVEDVTHTLFSNYKRFEENDYYLASIRKWMGLPSGGFLACSKKNIKSTPYYNCYFADMRREALLTKAQYISGEDDKLKPQYLELFNKAESFLNEDLQPYYIDDLSRKILASIVLDEFIDSRRKNFEILRIGLKDVSFINPIFKDLPDSVCPLFYPIYINEKRNDIRQKLIEKNVYCPIHWPVPKQVNIYNFENSTKIYNRCLSIPCDQRYGKEDMQRVISELKEEKV